MEPFLSEPTSSPGRASYVQVAALVRAELPLVFPVCSWSPRMCAAQQIDEWRTPHLPVVLCQQLIYIVKFQGLEMNMEEDIRDLTADLMAEVCNNVCTESELQLPSSEALQRRSANCQDSVRVNIRVEGF